MCDSLERVDVQAAVGLVQNRIFGLEHGQLQNLRALFFATVKTFIDRTRSERAIHTEQLYLFVKLRVIVSGFEFLALRETRLRRGAQEICDGDSRNFAWILKCEKEPFAGALVRFEVEK